MKSIIQKKRVKLTAFMCCMICLLSGCNSEDEVVIPLTTIHPIASATATIGDEITLTGQNMHLIGKINFGEVVVPVETLPADRDHSSLTVVVPTSFVATQKVVFSVTYNSTQRIILSDEFEVIVPPVIPSVSTTLSGEVNVGDVIEISGMNLMVVKSILANNAPVSIRSKNETTITFKAPEVETDTEFTITLVYDNALGSDQKLAVPGKVTVKKAVVLSYFLWENITLGAPATDCAFFDASAGHTITPCELFQHQSDVDFAMDATTTAAARLLNPTSINDNFMKAQLCSGVSLFEDGKDYATVRTSLKTQFKLLSTSNTTEEELIRKVVNGEITDIREDIGDIVPSTNTPTVDKDNVIVFKNTPKDKIGIIRVKSITLGEKKELNTIIMDVYYEK